MLDKKKLTEKLKVTESAYNSALSTFLNSNKRVDRDRVLTLRGKVNLLSELIKELK